MSASPAHCCPKTSTPRLFFSRSLALPGGSHSTESAELLTEDSSSDQASHPAARSVEDIWIRVVARTERGCLAEAQGHERQVQSLCKLRYL
ncbi:hypothetical protein ZIOFF_026598 [Zingiber officinale]|uniref:Uncharacterized protein n=1 Tax=Zingiber officinale TaxID=94328 RepID=A0A8J5H523_ZINOF|nr:hypothetical protein ZIOFF_026598 [Zingiber officinale]